MVIFDEFAVGSIDLTRLNFGIITLIPKVLGAVEISQFRPSTVINVIFCILTKGYANRVNLLADRITHPDQSAFIRGRFILDGLLVLHETMHEVRSRNIKAVFLKLDFHMAYDTISWDFLWEVLLRKGFDDRWVTRVMHMAKEAEHIRGIIPHFMGDPGVSLM
ncbi:retrotransposon protein [Hordeum vulgare]|nr:retrotransposon protein [Hordeum vulgare]